MNVTTTIKFAKGTKKLRGSYGGGAYIDLTFGDCRQPIEVINVWDYATDTVDDPDLHSDDSTIRRAAVRKAMRAWMESWDDEWPEWYEGYIENSRY